MKEPTPGMVEFWARQKPNTVAIVDGDAEITWRQWNDEADRLAHGLKARGIAAGDIVVTRLQIRKEWPIISSALGNPASSGFCASAASPEPGRKLAGFA